MKKAPIAIVAVIVVFAFIGGYFTGIMNSAGNFTLNITNKTNDNSGTSYDDTPTTTYKTNTAKTTVKNTADTTTTTDTNTQPQTNTQTEPSNKTN